MDIGEPYGLCCWRCSLEAGRAASFKKPDGRTNFLRNKRCIENVLFVTVGFMLYLVDGV